MERNRENRNRNINDWNQASGGRDNRDQDLNRYEGRYYNAPGQSDYGHDENSNRGKQNRNDWAENNGSRRDQRLGSMGELGNDWSHRNDYDDTRGRNGGFERAGNEYGQGRNEYYGQNSQSEYGGRTNSRIGERDYIRYEAPTYNRGENSRNWWDKTTDEVSSWFGDDRAQQRRDQDQQQGEHRGKGPKGYTRSDDRIKEDVNERLSDHGHIDASEIEVDVKSGEVFLKGTVKSREEKRRAEDIIENISGVKNVENHIKVQQEQGYTNNNSWQSNEKTGDRKFGSATGSGYTASAINGEINSVR